MLTLALTADSSISCAQNLEVSRNPDSSSDPTPGNKKCAEAAVKNAAVASSFECSAAILAIHAISNIEPSRSTIRRAWVELHS